MERLSSPHHLEPVIALTPFILYFFYQTVFVLKVGFWAIAGMWLLAMVFWTMMEYFLHRFFFHLKPKSEWLRKMIYAIHGCHTIIRLILGPAL